VVFAGDLVNRGPDTRSVLDLVAGLVDAGNAVVVRGNHEIALASYWRGLMSFVDFALTGGLPTLRSYIPGVCGDVWTAFRAAFPDSHRRVMEAAVDEYRFEDVLVRHWDNQAESALTSGVGVTDHGGTLVVGHTVLERARRIGDVVLLDSGCGSSGGPLSAFLWPEGTIISTTAPVRS
jgi:serine/threonine protein phosphatase 1